jgi:hypothetical protein
VRSKTRRRPTDLVLARLRVEDKVAKVANKVIRRALCDEIYAGNDIALRIALHNARFFLWGSREEAIKSTGRG